MNRLQRNGWLLLLGYWLAPICGWADELPEAFTNRAEMDFKLIPAGEFMMGSAKSHLELLPLVTIYAGVDRAMKKEHPRHQVRITQPFFLATTEVTQGQWERVMGTRPWSGKSFVKEGPDVAATSVSWKDAQQFCVRLGQLDRRTYRLPSEAEWEYACRAGSTTIFSFGDDEADLPDFAWFDATAYKQPDEKFAHRVARRKPNRWGLHDIHGNVWEWCADWYGNYDAAPVADPVGPATGSERVVRGGSWLNGANHSRSAFRFGFSPDHANLEIGFRVVCVPADQVKN